MFAFRTPNRTLLCNHTNMFMCVLFTSWENSFVDLESGIAFYEWAIGSNPGHADIIPFVKTKEEQGNSDLLSALQEGHSYYISVKVSQYDCFFFMKWFNLSSTFGNKSTICVFIVQATNGVGLISVQTFGAYLVDASPPIPGHVYDGIPSLPSLSSDGKKDQDFQADTTTLYASWEGFHDPHSSLIGYWWTCGTCANCDDVLPEQYVGLQTCMYL